MRMGIHPQYSQYPQVHSHIISSQGARIMLLLLAQDPELQVHSKIEQCRSLLPLDHWDHRTSFNTQGSISAVQQRICDSQVISRRSLTEPASG